MENLISEGDIDSSYYSEISLSRGSLESIYLPSHQSEQQYFKYHLGKYIREICRDEKEVFAIFLL